MFCEQCGSVLEENSKFCEQCGSPVNGNIENSANTIQPKMLGQSMYYGNQPQIIVQAPEKKFSFFHLFIGIAVLAIAIVVVCVSIYVVKKLDSEKSNGGQQNTVDAGTGNEAYNQDQQTFNAIYSMYCGTYELELIRENGAWKNYNTVGEVAGGILDFINLYEHGSQTDMYQAPTITLSSNSIDMTSFEYGEYSLDYFHYEEINEMDFFINDVHGFAIFHDGTYLYLAFPNEQGAWQGELAFE